MNKQVLQVQQRFSIIGQAPALRAAIERALRVAQVDLSVLVIGESGSGKEHFPKIIYENSPRKHKKYIAVNCGAIPEGTIDSELFGHVKGSFTGADRDHKGYFEEANGGVIFLDEVAEMPLSTQARLLRVLESGEFIKVGSSTVQKTDIRVVAATNKDLPQAIKDGKFREDLYYRLSTVQIDVPPLRERGNDILLLTRKFLHDFVDNNHVEEVELDDSARRRLLGYHWPGNVRQLKNITEQMSVLCHDREINAQELLNYIPRDEQSTELATIDHGKGTHSYENERELLYKILYELKGNVSDLRREMNSLRKQLNDARQLDVTAQLRQNEFGVKPGNLPAPAGTTIRPAGATFAAAPEALDATAEEISEPESLNLNDLGRQMVEKALQRNGGNRKKAARELGISDRTLYRRIKQYGLENNK